MRVVYGTGAVAVVSVIAVGLVQPDFTATAEQTADTTSTDGNAVAADYTQNQADTPRTTRSQGSNNAGKSQPNVQVNHVTRYIHLKPGQTAPPGAKVIQPGQPTPRIVINTRPAPGPNPPAGNPPAAKPPVATQPPANHPSASHRPNPGAGNAPPVHNPAPPPPPPPAPRPTTKTHQSGHP